MTALNDEQLAEIRKANEARTQGEWIYDIDLTGLDPEPMVMIDGHETVSSASVDDAYFIAKAPEYVTNLLDTVEEQRTEIRRLRST